MFKKKKKMKKKIFLKGWLAKSKIDSYKLYTIDQNENQF